MNYKEFETILKKNNLTVDEVKSALGYGDKSIGNNWKTNNKIPDKALIALEFYLELKKIPKKIKTEHDTRKITLSEKAYIVATRKSKENDIDVGEYISSLVIAAI